MAAGFRFWSGSCQERSRTSAGPQPVLTGVFPSWRLILAVLQQLWESDPWQICMNCGVITAAVFLWNRRSEETCSISRRPSESSVLLPLVSGSLNSSSCCNQKFWRIFLLSWTIDSVRLLPWWRGRDLSLVRLSDTQRWNQPKYLQETADIWRWPYFYSR